MKGNLFKIKKDKVEQWIEWCKKIATIYHKEALETLYEEEIIQELFCIFEIDGESYTIGLSESKNLPATSRQINIEHKKQAQECLIKIGKVDCLYHLKAKE